MPASTSEIAKAFAISGNKTAQKPPMAVISPVKAPQATWDLGMAGGRSACRLASWREREVEKRDGVVRFYVHPSLPKLE